MHMDCASRGVQLRTGIEKVSRDAARRAVFENDLGRDRSRKRLAEMTYVRRLESLIDRVHGVAGVADVCLCFVDRVVISGKACDDGDSGAVKTEMGKSDTAEELKPSFRRIFGQLKQNCALLF